MKFLKKLSFAAILILAGTLAHAGGATPVRIAPTGGPCTTQAISVGAFPITSTFTSTYVMQRFVEFQSQSGTDVYMSFSSPASSTTARAFYNAGDTLALDASENLTVYFTGDGASGKIIATYCK